MNNKTIFSALLIGGVFFLFSQAALAHKVNMFAYAEGGDIFMEGYFADGKKAKNSNVTVFNAAGDQLHAGTTDIDGQHKFAIPEFSDLRIVLNAGMGHQAEFLIPVDELNDTDEEFEDDAPTQQTLLTTKDSSTSLNKQELTQIVDRAVAKAMRPVMRSIAEMREEKSLSSIVGGIGFIFGMMGLYFYFKAKKDFENRE